MSLIGPLIGLGGSVAGAVLGSNAAQDAANTAAQTQLTMYNQTRSDLLPYMQGGNAAFSQLGNMFTGGAGGGPNASAMMSQLTQTPGYQFGLQQGQQALDRSAASRGLLLSGAQLKDSQQFGTDYAIQQAWQPYVNQLNTMSQIGENAGAHVGTEGTVLAGNAGTAQMAGGNAAAAGYTAMGGYASQLGNSLSSYFSGLGGGGAGFTDVPF